MLSGTNFDVYVSRRVIVTHASSSGEITTIAHLAIWASEGILVPRMTGGVVTGWVVLPVKCVPILKTAALWIRPEMCVARVSYD